MKKMLSVCSLVAILFSACSIPLIPGLASAKATLHFSWGTPSRSLSDAAATLTLSGTGPDGATIPATNFTKGDTVSLTGLAPGSWDLAIAVKDSGGVVLQTGETTAVLLAGQVNTVSITVHSRGAITGKLLTDQSVAVAGAKLWAADLDANPVSLVTIPGTSTPLEVLSGTDGTFTFEELPRHRIQLFVIDTPASLNPQSSVRAALALGGGLPTGVWWKPQIVEASQTEAQDLGTWTAQTAQVYGTAKWNSVPLPNLELSLDVVSTSTPLEYTWSSTTGAKYFFFTSVTPDDNTMYDVSSHDDTYSTSGGSFGYSIRYNSLSVWEISADGFSTLVGGLLNLSLSTGRILFTYTDGVGKDATAGMPVDVSGPNGFIETITTDANGVVDTYGFALATGAYTLTPDSRYSASYPTSATVTLTTAGATNSTGTQDADAAHPLVHWAAGTAYYDVIALTGTDVTITIHREDATSTDFVIHPDGSGVINFTFPVGTYSIRAHSATYSASDGSTDIGATGFVMPAGALPGPSTGTGSSSDWYYGGSFPSGGFNMSWPDINFFNAG